MRTLYLIRHTAPDIAPGICYGQLDIGVTKDFEEDAARILHMLPPLDLVVSSPLSRAHLLAQYLADRLHCPVRTDPRLAEIHFGGWEGKAWQDIPRAELDAWSADILDYSPPCGESARQLLQRIQEALQEVAALPQRNLALVCHGGSIRAMLALLSDVPLARTLSWQVGYGAVIGIRLESRATTGTAPGASPGRCRSLGE